MGTEIISPLSTDAILSPSEYTPNQQQQQQETKIKLPWLLENVLCLIHLAVFGILGVLTRYLLQKLFGPGGLGVTSDQSFLYLDLPSNMVGSFLMGWLGVVFKSDIAEVSEFLAIGLSTGYLGSLTTFSGWNQKMIELAVQGQWVFAVLGFFIGMFLVAYSIIVGIQTAEGFKWHLHRLLMKSEYGISSSNSNWKLDSYRRHVAVMVLLFILLGVLWGISAMKVKTEFSGGGSEAQLWLGCIVGPFGVWLRWLFSRFNGRGIGRAELFKWLPFGTLAANISAACIMALLATLKREVKTKNCDTIATGIQFGLLGCLSTVSTFIAEFHAMNGSKYYLRAFAYATITILPSFVLGILIYAVPVWTKAFD